ncbi:MAG: hypothetical protein ABI824_05715 [Acidobacteriota bacterium]
MRSWFKKLGGNRLGFGSLLKVSMVSLAAALALFIGYQPASGQGPSVKAPVNTYKAPRTKDGKPNLNGIWQAMNTANWDLEAHAAGQSMDPKDGAMFAIPPGLSVVVGGSIPYLPAALEKKKQNFANRLKLDPENKCYMGGIPRAHYMGHPFQIIQGGKDMMFVYQYAGAVRTINMGKPIEAPADSWMGQSNGHWEGETLVIDVTSQVEDSWFDRAGDFHSDKLHVVERYTPRSADTLWYEARIEDPKTFSQPWTIRMPLYRHVEENAQILEFKCVEFAEELLYGHLRKPAGAPSVPAQTKGGPGAAKGKGK